MQQVVGTKGLESRGRVQMLDNPFKHGASGGAWIGELTTSHVGGNYAIGLNSFILASQPDKMWSPLFDSKFVDLYHYAVGKA